uniref:Uncharacterized protein n=1 Tax=Anas platyrhynchos TaxID=8839 RepID=A0A8B9ZBL7_ANAPL
MNPAQALHALAICKLQRKLTEKPSPGKYTFVFSNFLAEESREQRVHWPHAPIVRLLIIICIRQAHTSSIKEHAQPFSFAT